MAVATTDVVLEGPMLGIWYWTLFGIGIAVTRLLARDPDFFDRAEDAAQPPPPERAAAAR
jgi:hypothetical protein